MLGASDLGIAFGLIGMTWLATIAFVVQSITVEMNELYAASLATSNAIGLRRTTTNIIADYFIVQRMRYPAGLSGLPAVN